VGHSGHVFSVPYSPDRQYTTSGSDDKIIRTWDVDTGNAVGNRLMWHSRPVCSVAYSPDGQYVAFGSDGRTTHVRDSFPSHIPLPVTESIPISMHNQTQKVAY